MSKFPVISKFPKNSKFLEILYSKTTSWVSVIFKGPFSIKALNNKSKQRWFYETTFWKLLLSVFFTKLLAPAVKFCYSYLFSAILKYGKANKLLFVWSRVYFVDAVTLRTNFEFVSEETICNESLHYVLCSISNQFLEASFNERENLFLVSIIISCSIWSIMST